MSSYNWMWFICCLMLFIVGIVLIARGVVGLIAYLGG